MNKMIWMLLTFLFLSVGHADRGAGFVAPTISGKSNVSSPTAGEIIFDTTDTQFWGYTDASTWLPLGSSTGQVMPAGAVLTFAGSSCPAGYLLADGTAISRSGTYTALFDAIGIAHGSGDGTTTFNLPDYRGLFLRMVDGSAGRDPDKASRTAMNTGGATGNNVGSVQSDGFASHTHIQNAHDHAQNAGQGPTPGSGINVATNLGNPGNTLSPRTGSTTATNQNSGGNETRSKNAYVIYCVKY